MNVGSLSAEPRPSLQTMQRLVVEMLRSGAIAFDARRGRIVRPAAPGRPPVTGNDRELRADVMRRGYRAPHPELVARVIGDAEAVLTAVDPVRMTADTTGRNAPHVAATA